MMYSISLQEHWHDFEWGYGWYILPMIFFGLFMILFIVSMFSKKRYTWPWFPFNDDYYRERNSETALQILKKRYAKGEINKAEFDQIKKELAD